jgi:hypothetical protein
MITSIILTQIEAKIVLSTFFSNREVLSQINVRIRFKDNSVHKILDSYIFCKIAWFRK